ncbi:MAG TPA: hypothetical protein VMS98_10685 [Thermoanaerobaculia bacterium]|nr:hypothetical protein [Thermoanaerobaculia bacterium]
MEGAKSPDFLDLRTRAEFLELCGDNDGAKRLQEISLQVAREVDLICYAYQLMWRERLDDAIELLHYSASIYSDSWNVYHSLGEAFEQKGEFSRAIEAYRQAAVRVEDNLKREMIERRLFGLLDLAAAS